MFETSAFYSVLFETSHHTILVTAIHTIHKDRSPFTKGVQNIYNNYFNWFKTYIDTIFIRYHFLHDPPVILIWLFIIKTVCYWKDNISFYSVLSSTKQYENRKEMTMTRYAYFPSRCRIGTQRSTFSLCKDHVSPKVSPLQQLVASRYSKGLTVLWLIIISTMHPAKVEQTTNIIRNPQSATRLSRNHTRISPSTTTRTWLSFVCETSSKMTVRQYDFVLSDSIRSRWMAIIDRSPANLLLRAKILHSQILTTCTSYISSKDDSSVDPLVDQYIKLDPKSKRHSFFNW